MQRFYLLPIEVFVDIISTIDKAGATTVLAEDKEEEELVDII